MSSNQHTPEPWQAYLDSIDSDGYSPSPIVDSYGHSIIEGSSQELVYLTPSDARRIVSCVNELAGKPEGYVKELEQQRDELLEALKYHQEQTRPIQRTIDLIAKFEDNPIAGEK